MQTLWEDLRFAFRILARQKMLTVVATLTLALGMGVNSAIFSTVSALLWNTLPYPASDRLVAIWGGNPRQNFNQVNVSFREVEHYRSAKSFDQITSFRYSQVGLRAAGAPQNIPAVETGAGFFDILEVAPALGRTFRPEELELADHRVAIITAGLWQREFAADPNILGRDLLIDGRAHSIVGVMPPDFNFLYSRSEVFLPLRLTPDQRARRDFRSLRAFARLAPGYSVAAAAAELRSLAQSLEDSEPASGQGWTATVRLLDLDVIDRGARTSINTMFWAVMGVLLIACANIASLLLARGALRQRELAIRASLGAGQARIARLLVTESMVLSFIGGALATAFAWWAIPVLRSLAPKDFPRLELVQLNPATLAYTFLLCLISGLIAGAMPAWMLTRGELARTLHEGGRGGTFSRQRVLQGLVTAEVTLAMVLLTVTGLLVRSLSGQLLGDPGFDKSRLLTAAVTLPESTYPERRHRTVFFQSALENLLRDPRIESASAVQSLPLAGSSSWTAILIEGQTPPPPGERNLAGFLAVLPGYFDTLRIPVIAGRDFNLNDTLDAEPVAIINQTMAKRYWPTDPQPLGRRLTLAGAAGTRPIVVVGITRDIRHNGPARPPRPELFLPVAQSNHTRLFFVARTRAVAASGAAAIRAAVWAVDRNLPVAQMESMDDVIDRRYAGPRVTVQILGFIAALALLLAGIGIFGVLSYLTSQRAREIGIRIAMGAQKSHVIRLVLRRGFLLAGIGLALGIASAAALTPLIRSILDGVHPHDLRSFSWSALALLLTAIAASAAPVLRALRCDPIRILRDE